MPEPFDQQLKRLRAIAADIRCVREYPWSQTDGVALAELLRRWDEVSDTLEPPPHDFTPGLFGLASQEYLCHICGTPQSEHADRQPPAEQV